MGRYVNLTGGYPTTGFEVAYNQVNDIDYNVKFGQNPDIDTTSDPEDIWDGGGLYTGQPPQSQAAETIEVVSGDANDTELGSGAQFVQIQGLDENWEQATEVFTLNGGTTDPGLTKFHRVYRIKVIASGTTGANEGSITVQNTTTGDIFAVLQAGANQSTVAAVTVPAGKRFLVVSIQVAIGRLSGTPGSATWSLRAREAGNDTYRSVRYETITTSYSTVEACDPPIVFEAKTDLIFRIENVSDSNTFASARLAYYIV